MSYKEVILLEFLYVLMADKPKQMGIPFKQISLKQNKNCSLGSATINTENKKVGEGVTNFYFQAAQSGTVNLFRSHHV